MKILMIGQVPKEIGGSYTTGVANVILALVKELEKENIVHIYATNYNPKLDRLKPFNISWPNKFKILKNFVLELYKITELVEEIKNYKYKYGIPALKFLIHRILLKKIINKFNPDIIHCHGVIFSPLIPYLNLQVPILSTMHGIMYQDLVAVNENRKRGIDLPKIFINGSKIKQYITYLTREMRTIGENSLSFTKDKGRIIPNGVDTNKFQFCQNSRLEIRKGHNIRKDAIIFLSIGVLSSRKNHLGAIDFIIKNNIDCHYWIIGKDAGSKNEISQKIIDYNLQEKVKFFDYISHLNLYKYYSACDFYLHPSTSEGQALVILEALACGCPSIVNKEIKGTLELKNEFLEHIQLIDLKSSHQRIKEKLSDKSRELLSEKFNKQNGWNIIADQYFLFYQDILNKHSIEKE